MCQLPLFVYSILGLVAENHESWAARRTGQNNYTLRSLLYQKSSSYAHDSVVYTKAMISAGLLGLLGLLVALIITIAAVGFFLFLVVFKKGLKLPITSEKNPPNQTPS